LEPHPEESKHIMTIFSLYCKSSAKSGLILVKTKRVFSKSLILNYYENT
jgi:hypothetical protein